MVSRQSQNFRPTFVIVALLTLLLSILLVHFRLLEVEKARCSCVECGLHWEICSEILAEK